LAVHTEKFTGLVTCLKVEEYGNFTKEIVIVIQQQRE
jgi:hypothetical protein